MLHSSGKISMRDVNVELRKPENSRISLIDNEVRNLACVNSNNISLNNLKGKGKCKIHISVTNMIERIEMLTVVIIHFNDNELQENFSKSVELDYELLVGDTINLRSYCATGRLCEFKIDDSTPDPYNNLFKVSKNHKIICNFKDFI